MCEYVIAAGLYNGTPEQLWNNDPGGHLITPHDLYWKALVKNGHTVEVELPDVTRTSMMTGFSDQKPLMPAPPDCPRCESNRHRGVAVPCSDCGLAGGASDD
ncbi:hypothetical protein SAMN05444166_2411 [Singulisphaera sp. GP187]|nr:hypothetical protein SAMN05444166_2411 [Singulisphaera sp. GP187]